MRNLLMEAEEHPELRSNLGFLLPPPLTVPALSRAGSGRTLVGQSHFLLVPLEPSSSLEFPPDFMAYVAVWGAGHCGAAVSTGRKVEDDCPGELNSPFKHCPPENAAP